MLHIRKENTKMFNNIGGKIKVLAQVVCWIGIVLFVIVGLALILQVSILVGCLTIIVGCFVSWIGSFFTYGFGELIEKTTEIANNTSPKTHYSNKHEGDGFTSKTPKYSNEDIIEGFGELFK